MQPTECERTQARRLKARAGFDAESLSLIALNAEAFRPRTMKSSRSTEKRGTMNVGTWDRWIRVIVGAVLVVLAATDRIGAWGWIGVIPLVTGLIGRCPMYSALGLNTCPVQRRQD